MEAEAHEAEPQRGRRRHKWGPIPGQTPVAAAAPAPAPTRKRKSRWGDDGPAKPDAKEGGDDSKAIVLFPEKVVLSNGLQIVLPPAVTGRAPGGDPEVLELHKQVRTWYRCCGIKIQGPAARAHRSRTGQSCRACPLVLLPAPAIDFVRAPMPR